MTTANGRLSVPPRQISATTRTVQNKDKMSLLQSNTAQHKQEQQRRMQTFQDDTGDRFPQRLAEGSKVPAGELARADGIHGHNAQSLRTTNCSVAGGSSRASSVATSTSVGSSEAPEPYPPYVASSLPRRPCHVLVHEASTSRRDKTGSCTASPLISTKSSQVSGLSVSNGMGERALVQRMRLLGEDGTVGNTLCQQGPILECPFHRITRCQKKKFSVSNFEAWMTHTQEHFVKYGRRGEKIYISPPTLNRCGFCDEKFEAVNGNSSWGDMMSHLKEHHELGHRLAHFRIDFSLVEYLWQKKLLTHSEYRDLKPNAQDVPSPPSLSDDEEPVAEVEQRRHRGERSSVRGVS